MVNAESKAGGNDLCRLLFSCCRRSKRIGDGDGVCGVFVAASGVVSVGAGESLRTGT
jgi:hypothetical protein